MKFAAGLRLALERQNERARRRFGQAQRPAFLSQQTRAGSEVTQHRRQLRRVLDVCLFEAGLNQRLGDIESRRASQLTHGAFDAFELNYRSNALVQSDSSGGIPGINES